MTGDGFMGPPWQMDWTLKAQAARDALPEHIQRVKKAYSRGQGGKSEGIARHLMPLSTRWRTASIICRWQ